MTQKAHNRFGRNAALALLAVACCATASPPSRAQEAGMDRLAGQLAAELHGHHVKTVAVTRLTSQNSETNYALSIWVSDQLATALAGGPNGLAVIPRSALLARAATRHVSPIDMGLIEVLSLFAREAGADAVVQGEFTLSGQTIQLNVYAYDLRSLRNYARVRGAVDEIPQVIELKDTPVRDSSTGVYLPGVAGVNYPECLACQNPQFSAHECRDQPGFAILLVFTVTAEGRVTDIEVVRGEGLVNDKAALDAVHAWRFRPAQLPDGVPVASRMADRLACNPD